MRPWLLLLCTLQLLLGLAGFSLSPVHALSHEASQAWAMDTADCAALGEPATACSDGADADATSALPELAEAMPIAAPPQARTALAARPQEPCGRHPDGVTLGRLPRPPQPLA